MDEKGEPLFEEVAPDLAWDGLLETFGGNEANALDVVDSIVADKKDTLKKLQGKKLKAGGTVMEKIAAQKERQAAIDKAKAELDKWQGVASVRKRRADEKRRMEAEAQRKAAREKADRKAAQEKAIQAANKAVVGENRALIEREQLSQGYILDTYATQADAQSYLDTIRQDIRRRQEETKTALEENDRMLADHENGNVSLTDTELADLARRRATLERTKAELSDYDYEVGKSERTLPLAYKQRNDADEASLPPAEQRRLRLARASKGGSASLLEAAKKEYHNSGYADILDDLEPQTAEELVAGSLAPHSINFEGMEVGGVFQNGLQQELGISRGIGHGKDTQAINLFLAEKGKGRSVDAIVHDIWEDRPSNLEGLSTSDIKNALLSLLMDARSSQDITNYIVNNRIATVEQIVRAEEEQEADYMSQVQGSTYAPLTSFAKEQARTEYLDYLDSVAEELALTPSEEAELLGIIADEIAAYEEERAEIEEILKQLNEQYNGQNRERRTASGESMDSEPEQGAIEGGTGESQAAVRAEAADRQAGEGSHTWQPESHPGTQAAAAGNGHADGGLSVQGEELSVDRGNAEAQTMSERIQDWLSDENLEWAEGRSLEEIIEHFGNELEPIATMPSGYLKFLGTNTTDANVYSGKGYFIDHAVNHHDEEPVEEYLKIQDILSNPTDVKIDNSQGRPTLLFIKKYDKYYVEMVSVGEDGTGRVVLHKSFFHRKKMPHKALPSVTLESSPTVENPVISPSQQGEAGSSEISALGDGGKGSQSSDTKQGKGEKNVQAAVEAAEQEVDAQPTDAQKEAGNYKKGHVKVADFDITIENAKGSVRSGVDANGKAWSNTMHNTYGYIRGTESVDGDHIDVFLADDMDKWDGKSVFVVDQYNPDGSFDEHKVMMGFNDAFSADLAYQSNYNTDFFQGRRTAVSEVSLEDFKKWIDSSHRKTKPFEEYKGYSVRTENLEGEKSDEKAHSAIKVLTGVMSKFNDKGLDEMSAKERGRVAAKALREATKDITGLQEAVDYTLAAYKAAMAYAGGSSAYNDFLDAIVHKFAEPLIKRVTKGMSVEEIASVRKTLPNDYVAMKVSGLLQRAEIDAEDDTPSTQSKVEGSENPEQSVSQYNMGALPEYLQAVDEGERKLQSVDEFMEYNRWSLARMTHPEAKDVPALVKLVQRVLQKGRDYDKRKTPIGSTEERAEVRGIYASEKKLLDHYRGKGSAIFIDDDAKCVYTVDYRPAQYKGRPDIVIVRKEYFEEEGKDNAPANEGIFEKAERIAKEEAEKRKYAEPKPIGKGAFGNIYDQFKGRVKAAIEFLTKKQDGEATGALHHADIGDISLVWGNAKAGLQKIARKHPEVLDNLQQVLDEMHITKTSDNRIKLESDTHFAVVSREWLGEKRTPWLLTAYEKKESSATNNTMDTADTSKGKRNDTATPQDTASAGKVTTKTDAAQGKGKKKSQEAPKVEKPKNTSGNKLVTDERYEELKKRMRAKLLGQANMGVDPEILAIGTEMAVYHIEKGARKFAEYAKGMIADMGDAIRPYLKAFYEGAKNMPEVEENGWYDEMTPSDEVRKFDVANFDARENAETSEGSETANDARFNALIEEAESKNKKAPARKAMLLAYIEYQKAQGVPYDTEKTPMYSDDRVDDLVNRAKDYWQKVQNGVTVAPATEKQTAYIEKLLKKYPEEAAIVGDAWKNLNKAQASALIDNLASDVMSNEDAIMLQHDLEGIVAYIKGEPEFTQEQIARARQILSDAKDKAHAFGDIQREYTFGYDKTGRLVDEAELSTSEAPAVEASANESIFDKAERIAAEEEKKRKAKVSSERGERKEERGERNASSSTEEGAVGSEVAQAEEAKKKLTEQRNEGRRNGESASDYLIRMQKEEDERVKQRLRPATEADLENAPTLYHNGKAVKIVLLNHVDSIDGKPSVRSVMLTDGTTVKGEDISKELFVEGNTPKKTTEETPKGKEKGVSSQSAQAGLFDNVNDNDNEQVHLQDGRTAAERKSGQEHRQNEPLGASERHEDERADGQRVGGRGPLHPVSESGRGGSVSRPSESEEPLSHPKNTRNNRGERGAEYAPKGVDARIDANIKAIELMQQLLESGEEATPEQMRVLRKFSGWGGLDAAFNTGGYDWKQSDRNKHLRELLGEEAYKNAAMSANSSFYTPTAVIDSLWDIARKVGFKGGRVLEGSAGIGNILAQMPADMSERSDIEAVEIDPTAGGILSLLYPDAKVQIQGFEQTKVRNNSVDLAITNVPFVTGLRVKDETGDKDLAKKFRNIHDFCIAKNVRKLREGGIGIFITSSGTLDNSQKLRNWLVSEGGADVVGAFRLNNKTFGSATAVTSDIIVVRKRVNGKPSANAIDVSTVSTARTSKPIEVKNSKGDTYMREMPLDYNRYFIEHPEMMAGEMFFQGEKGDTYHPTSKSLYPVAGKEQGKMLEAFVESLSDLSENSETTENSDAMPSRYEELGESVKEGSMVLDKNGTLCIAQYGQAVPLLVNSNKVKGHTKTECFTAYSAIKDAVDKVLDYQTLHEGDDGLKPLLKQLNKAYDDFVTTYGRLHKNTSISFLKNDVDFASVLALEKFSETGDEKGNRVQTFEKTDIFKRRVVEKAAEPHPTNVQDGVVVSIQQHGRIDIPYIAELLGQTEEAVKQEVIKSGLGFEDPVSGEVVVKYEYLSGNVRQKLRQARENNVDGRYDGNIRALEAKVPMNIPAHLIEFTLGSSWVNPKLYEDYIKERTGLQVGLKLAGGNWLVDAPYYVMNEKNKAMGVRSELLHKTIFGHELIAAAIQNKTIRVSQTHKVYGGGTETITDKEATAACAAKIDEIRQDFKDWARQRMQTDAALSEEIERVYNEQFNNYVPLTIDEAFVPTYFVGASHKFKLRPHQGAATVRATMQPLMLAHEVGTGKTFTLITSAMEMRRLGTAKKPMIVVQNATVGQFVADAKALYPNAKVLTLSDKDRTKEGRKDFYAKIRYNDWDMIVIPQSVLDTIPDSKERQKAFIHDKIDEKKYVLEQMREAGTDSTDPAMRQAERELAQLEDELLDVVRIDDDAPKKGKSKKGKDLKREAKTEQNAKVKAEEMLDRKTDDTLDFDAMGIDALLVDEAHEYKHLGFATSMQRGVKGVDPSYSKKSQGVYLKVQSVLEKSHGKNVVFATGTPISNTAAEVWTFMRYLMSADTMKEYGIYYFDDFVRNFGNLQQMLEFNTNGKFKEVNRFAGYNNLPELIRMWLSVADTVKTEDNKELLDKIPLTEVGTETDPQKAEDIYLPQTKALRSVMKYVKQQLEDYEKMSGKEKKENSHIPLTMYGIAKAAAVDARLVVNDAQDEPSSKTNEAVRQTLRSLKDTSDYKGTVAIFADNYQNKQSGFNLYEDIRKKLIAEGVPAEQVAIIKSGMTIAKKQEIFDKVNRGEIRVIMGSTFTLGTGVNIQERLHTLIHVDAPNRPMDYTQRNGRILRQGNLHKQWGKRVRVLRFGVEDSLDVTAYQRLKTKGAIANSIMDGKKLLSDSMANRVMEEEEDVFGDTVAQLSGSEYAMLKNQMEKEVRKLNARKKQWEADQIYIHNAEPRLEGQLKADSERAAENRRLQGEMESHFKGGTFKRITAGKEAFASLDEMGDYFKAYNKGVAEAMEKVKQDGGVQHRKLTLDIDGYEFEVNTVVEREMGKQGASLFSKATRTMTYSCERLGLKDMPVKNGYLKNAVEDIVENVITGKDFKERAEAAEAAVERNKGELETLRKRKGSKFEGEADLQKAQEKLDEYTELMKAELAEKEAKYAAMDAEVETATDVVEAEEDSEEANEAALAYFSEYEDAQDGTISRKIPEDVEKSVSLRIEKEFEDRIADIMSRIPEDEQENAWEHLIVCVDNYSKWTSKQIQTELRNNESTERLESPSQNTEGASARNSVEIWNEIARAAADREFDYRRVRQNRLEDVYGIAAGKRLGYDVLEKVLRLSENGRDTALASLFDKARSICGRLGVRPLGVEYDISRPDALGVATIDRELLLSVDMLTRTATSSTELPVVVVHEMLHQGTMGAISLVKNGKAEGLLTPKQIDGVNEILSIYERVKNNRERFKGNTYGLDDAYEFAAQMADPRQRKALDLDIWQRVMNAARELLRDGDASLWQRLKNAIGKLFELSDRAKMDKALNDIMDDFNEVAHDIAMNDIEEEGFGYKVTDEDELERLNSEDTFKMYSTVQEVDGVYASPMAGYEGESKKQLKLTNTITPKDWYRSDETELNFTPEQQAEMEALDDGNKKGQVVLVKNKLRYFKGSPNGKGTLQFWLQKTPDSGLWANYNPYNHTSTSMMNDQFTGAYGRSVEGNKLVVAEWDIPTSEKTFGYKAPMAQDAEGFRPWHSGVVNALLPEERQRGVMLSRHRRLNRIVPYAEQAQSIADQLRGTGLAIPWNTHPYQVVEELAKLGVPITTVPSGSVKAEHIEFFNKQKAELEKKYPQTRFVDVKMTQDDYKVWGKDGGTLFREQPDFGEGREIPIKEYYGGRRFAINDEAMRGEYPSKWQLLDAFRSKYPQYLTTIENRGVFGEVLSVKPWPESGRKYSAAEQRAQEAYVERKKRRMEETARSFAKQLGVDGVEILTTTDGLEGRKARAKGWYDPRTGKVTIVLPNHRDSWDVRSTMFHEVVAHLGLRKLVGEAAFNDFLDNIYNNASLLVRKAIDRLTEKYGNRRTATEEYMASLAEDMEFNANDEMKSWWQRIKEFAIEMLRKAGIDLGFRLSDSELRYILWRSYKNLTEPGTRTIFDEAEDIAMQDKLKVGDYQKGDAVTAKVADDAILFRDSADRDRLQVREAYERAVSTASHKFTLAWQDSMDGLNELQKSIEEAAGHKLADWENAYMAENRMSSINLAEMEAYKGTFYKDMLNAIDDLTREGLDYTSVVGYVLAKHGLERNVVLAFRDAVEAENEDFAAREAVYNAYANDADRKRNDDDFAQGRIPYAAYRATDDAIRSRYATGYAENRERDYSGLTSLFEEDGVADAETKAAEMVKQVEDAHKPLTDALWRKVNAATDAALVKQCESGLMTRQRLASIRQMFKWYVPLKGFDETTSDEVYNYYADRSNRIGGTLDKHAKGRKSIAADPFATIGNDMERAIMQGNRNRMKQHFLKMVINNPSDAVSVSELYLRKDDATDEWIPQFVDTDPADDAATVERKVEAWNNRMEQLCATDPDHYKRSKDAPNVPYRVIDQNIREHQVLVKMLGKAYVLTINGNPEAAQALNGLTNPDTSEGVQRFFTSANHFMAAMFTQKNPAFLVSNLSRDAFFANSMVWAKETPSYAWEFNRNWGKAFAHLGSLIWKQKNHTLGNTDKWEAYFAEFIANGGETGYTFMHTVADYKGIIADSLAQSRRSGWNPRSWLDFLDGTVDFLGRWTEDTSRFAAYVTSREMGRSMERSILDAKEITVNFNRKGAGAKAAGKWEKGNRLNYINAAVLAQNARNMYVFFNAGVQGLDNFGRTARQHKGKTAAMVGVYTLAGILMPMAMVALSSALGGGDDDNNYWDLPDYTRRNNVCIWAGGGWVTIPLPIELRAFYGLGETLFGQASGNTHLDTEEALTTVAGLMSQIMPLDVVEGGAMTFVPSYAKPIAELMANEDWTGTPIQRRNEFNKDMPEWTKAYSSTNQTLVKLSETLNEISGGDKYSKGAVDVSPASVEHIFEGYLGGVGKFINKTVNTTSMLWDEDAREIRNVPIVGNFYRTADERTRNRAVTEEYFDYYDEYLKTQKRVKGYEHEANLGIVGYAEKIDFLYNSKEYLRYEIMHDYLPAINALNKAASETQDNGERRQLQDELASLRRECVEVLKATEK